MMKNYAIKTAKAAAFGAAFLLLFASLSGASVWEGAAAVSSGAEFPDSGFYVATNSFPRNTVVDITNLETGKTIRGIVAANLDSPGLLAVISKECAEAIGLQSRSIGRIRMIQPADPVAFSRFGEGSLASGDPDYDPEAALKAYGESPAPDEPPPVEPDAGVSVAAIPPLPEKTSGDPENAEETGAEETPVDEAEEIPLIAAPVEEPPAEEPLIEETPESGPVDSGNAGEAAVVAVPVEEPVPAEIPAKDTPEEIADEKAETAGYSEPETAGVVAVTALPKEASGEEAEAVLAQAVPEEEVPEVAYPEESVWYTPPEEGSVFTLVPAEERPPRPVDTVPALGPEKPVLPPAYFAEEPAVPSYAPGIFSVPSVGELERGKYYLQLGAYSKSETVEREIAKIERNLPLAVQNAGNADRPLYRILVGPVNHGESGALLQRFRGIGYKDAFVRRGE
ncbi:MAG: SPOR domain-containing protein [Treponema sp.]|jgi:hypothetical protein|nr:SPOR domain-containing protein [Treponema sp.]